MVKDRAFKIDRQNKKCGCARKSSRRKNNDGIDKEEEKKLARPLAKKVQPAEGCSRRNVKREESSRQKKISDGKQHYDERKIFRRVLGPVKENGIWRLRRNNELYLKRKII